MISTFWHWNGVATENYGGIVYEDQGDAIVMYDRPEKWRVKEEVTLDEKAHKFVWSNVHMETFISGKND